MCLVDGMAKRLPPLPPPGRRRERGESGGAGSTAGNLPSSLHRGKLGGGDSGRHGARMKHPCPPAQGCFLLHIITLLHSILNRVFKGTRRTETGTIAATPRSGSNPPESRLQGLSVYSESRGENLSKAPIIHAGGGLARRNGTSSHDKTRQSRREVLGCE